MNKLSRICRALVRACPAIAAIVATVFVSGSSQVHAFSAAGASGCNLGNGRVTSVVAVDGGCVSGPTGPNVQSYDVVQGKTYTVTLEQVIDCANGGTDATIQVMVKNSDTGNQCYTATLVAVGTYTFDVVMPPNACNTYPIDYCTDNCDSSTGLRARRGDGGCAQVHLRAATFGPGCTAPVTDTDCTNCATDTDGDGTPDCTDGCPADPNKIDPGLCGCGIADTDTDGDGVPDCNDSCPQDPSRTEPGACGCGVAETDTDGDGTPDCTDGCPQDPLKTSPGVCGCGVRETDTDQDGVPDCNDGCPLDPNKTAPGVCGCGVAETDTDGDGVPDCIETDPNAFCFPEGDGADQVDCPCVAPNVVPNPQAAVGHGCANAFNLDGALLTATGTAAPDTIQFTCDVGPGYKGFAFLVVGNATMPAVPATDGIICVTRSGNGHVYRIGGHNAGTYGAAPGTWTYPNNTQTTPLSIASLQGPGTAYYQVYYRHAVPDFCNPSTANTSNGLQIVWP
jgi:hypothetical protein